MAMIGSTGRKGTNAPKMMTVGLHCRLAGRPGRAAGLARFLDYIAKHDKVWVATRLDMVHRLGSTLAVAESAGLAFTEAGIGPGIADGLVPLNTVTLGRLLLPRQAARAAFLQPEPALS